MLTTRQNVVSKNMHNSKKSAKRYHQKRQENNTCNLTTTFLSRMN